MNGLSNGGEATPMLSWMSSLADPTRARTLRLVETRELTVADLCAALQAPQSTVSRHLKVLADHGWVAARPEGPSRLYRMASADLDPAARRLWTLLREQVSQTTIAGRDDQRLARVLAERRSRSESFFSSEAGQWEKLRREMFGERFDSTALLAWMDESWVVGDLGCGTGRIAGLIAPFVRQVIAVEGSRAMLSAARRHLNEHDNVELRRGELETLPIDDGALDAATVCLVLHHLADPGAALREVARVLRPGGRLLVVDMYRHDRAEYKDEMGHVWLGFEPQQIVEWLEGAGFESTRVLPLPTEPGAQGPALFAASARSQSSDRTQTGNDRRSKPSIPKGGNS